MALSCTVRSSNHRIRPPRYWRWRTGTGGMRWRALRMAGLGLAVLAVACAGTDQQGAASGYDSFQASRLFSVGYKDIADIYIEDVEIPALALSGLKALHQVDPDVRVRRQQSRIALQLNGELSERFRTPQPKDADAWGALTAKVLEAALDRSQTLRRQESERLYARVFDGVLERLDAYSRYAGPEQARDNRASRDGFGGIGVTVEATADGVRVHDVRPNGPADEAGLEAGDLIVQIDGQPTAALSQREVVDQLRGRTDTSVELIVHREGVKAHLGMNVRRAHIVPETVAYHREGNAAYFRISGFNQNTADSLRDRVEQARRTIGSELTGYILDLRGNPGGLLDQAVDVSDLFVTDGRIVSTHGRHPDSHQYFSARPDDVGGGVPVVVLIDRGSASAAEIVAAAIQDSGRGLVIGTGSYGKGTVQTVLRLPNRGELTLTWARFHAPSGYALSKRGVLPDVCTSRVEGSADAVTAALRRGDLPVAGHLRRRAIPPDDPTAVADVREACPGQRKRSKTEIDVARRLLADRDLYRLASGRQPAAALAKAKTAAE